MPGILWKCMDRGYDRSALSNAERVPEETYQESRSAEETVRVYIRLEPGASKEDMIAQISGEALPETGLKVHNQNLAEDLLSADIPYGKIANIKAVKGVKEVSLVEEYGTLGTGQEIHQKKEDIAGQETQQNEEDTADEEQQIGQGEQQTGTQDNSVQEEEQGLDYGRAAVCAAGIVILLILLRMALRKRRKK